MWAAFAHAVIEWVYGLPFIGFIGARIRRIAEIVNPKLVVPRLPAASIQFMELAAKAAEATYGEFGVHPAFVCPITQDQIKDPVSVTGIIFERGAIEQWIGNGLVRHPMGSDLIDSS